jgi:hypothetical protein
MAPFQSRKSIQAVHSSSKVFFSLAASAACGSKLTVTMSACSPRLSRQVM